MSACLSPDDLAAYLRGRGDARVVESHVLDCPGCAMELLLAREALRELRPLTARHRHERSRFVRYVFAAAAALFAVALLAVAFRPKAAPEIVQTAPKPKPAPRPALPAPAPAPAPIPVPAPAPVPAPPPAPLPAPPSPAPPPAPPAPPAPPVPPAPKVEPPPPVKPAPAPTVERPVVARVTHAVGGPAGSVGRRIFAGEAVSTGKAEFLALAVDGLGQVWLREGSKAEFAGADVTLHEGGLMAKADAPATLRTPAATFEIAPTIVDLQSTKAASELSVLSGRASAGAVTADGPILLSAKSGRPAEAKPLEPGFASWLPDKLATKRFSAWIEAETFKPVGFRAMEFEAASGGHAMVQVEERAALALKTALPVRGRHVVWLRARQYVAKPVVLGIGINGQTPAPVRLDGEEGKPWRWVGPIPFTADRLDLVAAALSPNFHRPGDERRSFPVVVDAVFVSADPKAVPPDRIPEDPPAYSLVLDEPAR
jgi:hypothetical protein